MMKVDRHPLCLYDEIWCKNDHFMGNNNIESGQIYTSYQTFCVVLYVVFVCELSTDILLTQINQVARDSFLEQM